MNNIHEQIDALIKALNENTAALKGVAVAPVAETEPKKGRKAKETTAAAPAAEVVLAQSQKQSEAAITAVEAMKGADTPPPAPAAETKPAPAAAPAVVKPGKPEFIALAQKLLDAGKIHILREIKAKFNLSGGASSAVGTEHEDNVWKALNEELAK
jgi:hypothetical protein